MQSEYISDTQVSHGKICYGCKKYKLATEFHKTRRAKDGLNSSCKQCQKEYASVWNKNNKDKVQSNWRRQLRLNPEASRKRGLKWRLKNKEKLRIYSREYKKRKAAFIRSLNAKRQAALLNRFPEWANKKAIESFYEKARSLSIETGELYHVDHVIPLQGELVSGLHVENNLQVIRAFENHSKHNHFLPI